MNVLLLSRWFPYPADNGSKIRIFNLLKSLAQHHTVTLVSFSTGAPASTDIATLNTFCRKVISIPYNPFQPRRLTALAGYFSSSPRSVVDTYSREMHNAIRNECENQHFDLVIASQIDMAIYVRLVPHAIRILEEVELTTIYEDHLQNHKAVRRVQKQLTWWKYSRYIARILHQFHGATVVSQKELALLQNIASSHPPLAIIPNGIDSAQYSGSFGSPVESTLIYSGALSYHANYDAVQYFLQDILPLIKAQIPHLHFSVTGSIKGISIHDLPNRDWVTFTGYLEDIRPAIAQSWVNVVPIRIGGGTRLKILESLALGTPVISTSKGAEGLELHAGEDILIADTPSEFACHTVDLLQNPQLRRKLSQNGQNAVLSKYNWQQIGQQYITFIEECVQYSQNKHG